MGRSHNYSVRQLAVASSQFMTMTEPLRRWRQSRLRRVSDKQIAELRTALDRLGYGWWPLPLALRVAIRRRTVNSLRMFAHLIAAVLGVSTVVMYAAWVVIDAVVEPMHPGPQSVVGLYAWILLLTFTAGFTREAYVSADRFFLVAQCAEAIKACAEAHGAGGPRRTGRVQAVSAALRIVEHGVLKAYRTRGTVPHLSPRRTELRRHAGQVVARLRIAESRLDTGTPRDALEELAGLIATVAEQYVAGHVGALLSPASLDGLHPVRERELLRVGLSVSVIAGAAVTVSLLGVSDLAAGVLVSAVGVLALLLMFGRRWHQYLPVAEFFKPGP